MGASLAHRHNCDNHHTHSHTQFLTLLCVFSIIFPPHSQWFSPEMPEWDMEKYRFYLDLPGDFWESGTLLKYLREREVQVSTAVAVNTCYFIRGRHFCDCVPSWIRWP